MLVMSHLLQYSNSTWRVGLCNKPISILSISDDETLLGEALGPADGSVCFWRNIRRPGTRLAFCGERYKFAGFGAYKIT